MTFSLLEWLSGYLWQINILRLWVWHSFLFHFRKHLGELVLPLQSLLTQFEREHILYSWASVFKRRELNFGPAEIFTQHLCSLSWVAGYPRLSLGNSFLPLSFAVASVRLASPSSSRVNTWPRPRQSILSLRPQQSAQGIWILWMRYKGAALDRDFLQPRFLLWEQGSWNYCGMNP